MLFDDIPRSFLLMYKYYDVHHSNNETDEEYSEEQSKCNDDVLWTISGYNKTHDRHYN